MSTNNTKLTFSKRYSLTNELRSWNESHNRGQRLPFRMPFKPLEGAFYSMEMLGNLKTFKIPNNYFKTTIDFFDQFTLFIKKKNFFRIKKTISLTI